MVLVVGVRNIICTCGNLMKRMGGTFGGGHPATDTYFCSACQKHIIVVTPNPKEQAEFLSEVSNGKV